MTNALLTASWRVVARPPLLIPVGFALLLIAATWPWLDDGYAARVRVVVTIVLACGLAASADDPVSEVVAASPYPRALRCAMRLLVGLSLVLPAAALSLLLVEQQVSATPSTEVIVQVLALLIVGPAIGFGMWAWGDVTQAKYAATAGVLCFSFALWALPATWSVIKVQPWGPPWEGMLIRSGALVLLGLAILTAAWREPHARR